MEISPYHVTVKYPCTRGPEVMLNLHASTGEELDELLAHALPILQEYLGGSMDTTQDNVQAQVTRQARQLAARTQDEPRYESDEPAEGSLPSKCGGIGHFNRWMESQWGGWFCTGNDEREAAGKCRWVISEDGEMKRKRTKAESEAGKIVGRAGSRR